MMPPLLTMPLLSLSEATRRAIAAADAGDLDAVGYALVDREAAMATAPPAERAAALAEGETIGRLLADIKRNIVLQHNRLEQVREGFASDSHSASIDVQG
jgi:hypothetical protein